MRKYWREILVFGIIFGVLLLDLAPNMTWINTDSDGVHYVFAAKNMYLSHKTSAPLFLLLGKAFLLVPFGTDFWRMGLLSVVSTTIASVYISLIIKHFTNRRWLSLLGSVIYATSAVVISQSTIVETYPLVSMLSVAAYYYSLKDKWAKSSIMMGLGLAVHHLIGLVIIPLIIANKELRRPKYWAMIAAGLLFYLYIPISVKVFHSPDMWGNTTTSTFFGDNISTMTMLVGGLSGWDLPKRLLDTLSVTTVSLGASAILVAWYLITQKRILRNTLFWLFSLGTVYYLTNLAPQTYVYIMPSIAFGVVMAMVQLSKMGKAWVYSIAAASIALSVVNVNYFDIGRTLDPKLSATDFYKNELSKIPDGQILMAQYGWQWAMIYPYNKNEQRNIIPIDIDTLVSPTYQGQLREKGIQFEDNHVKDIATRQAYIATSIVKLNENVWTTRTTDDRTYGAEVIRAKDYPELVNRLPTEPPALLHWKPSNPYGIITGSIEIAEWKFLTYSNKNIRLYVLFVLYTMIPWFLFLKWLDRRKAATSAI